MGGSNPVKSVSKVGVGPFNLGWMAGSNPLKSYLSQSASQAGIGSTPTAPEPDSIPTDADIAAKEPDKERLRRQRMAALMAGGRLGTIFGGAPAGTQPNNMIGGGTGKTLVGA